MLAGSILLVRVKLILKIKKLTQAQLDILLWNITRVNNFDNILHALLSKGRSCILLVRSTIIATDYWITI
jgi:hypothetical protein